MAKIKKDKYKKIRLIIFISIILLFGIGFLILNWSYDFQEQKTNNDLINQFFTEEKTQENVSKNNNSSVDNYIAILEINKINLKRGLVDINSKRNNVKYNIQIIKPSDMPDVEKGNLILASHSGSGKVSFFKNLYKLVIDDEISLYYDHHQYIYKISNIYEIEKNGKAEIIRNSNKTTLTLITCSQVNKKHQIVFISELIKIENY